MHIRTSSNTYEYEVVKNDVIIAAFCSGLLAVMRKERLKVGVEISTRKAIGVARRVVRDSVDSSIRREAVQFLKLLVQPDKLKV